jgi:hypothetical protein
MEFLIRLLVIFALFFTDPTVLFAGTDAVDSLANRFEKSVVKLDIAKQASEVGTPWQRQDVSQSRHLGVVLSGGRVLTTAFAVVDATLIEMQRFGSSRRVPLAVDFVDYEVNIALLKPTSSVAGALVGLEPMALGEDLDLGSKVHLLKARNDNQLVRIAASLQEVGIYRAVTSAYSLPSYLFKLQQSGLGWSEPVISGNRLVGISTGQDSNYLHALPMSVIKHVLADDLRSQEDGGQYRGFPAIGVTLAPLVSPEYRKLLKVGTEKNGVRIAAVQVDSAFNGKLFPSDVLLAVGNNVVNDQGFVRHPLWGQIHLKYLVSKLYSGDVLNLHILRDGKDFNISAPLKRYDSNRAPISYYNYGHTVLHLIFGGLLFQELSRDYLQQWGKDWQDNAPFDFMYMWNYENEPKLDPSFRYVVLRRVLADEYNRGYEDYKHSVLESVNGIKVESLSQMEKVLREAPVSRGGRAYAVFVFKRGEGEIILAYDGLAKARERIAKTYEINTSSSFFSTP